MKKAERRTDATAPLSSLRLQARCGTSSPIDAGDLSRAFHRLTTPTLSHLLALILHPPPSFFLQQTALLVIDGLNSLIDLDYPRSQFVTSSKTEQQKWQAGRRYAILGSLIAALNKLAIVHDMAVVVTTGCSTRMRPDSGLGAALAPGVGGAEWESGIWNRIVVFRDFGARFIGVQKCQGKSLISREEVGEVGRIIAFDTAADGSVYERQGAMSTNGTSIPLSKLKSSPAKPRKRNFDEIADSEGEDVDEFGWAEADDDVLAAEGVVDDVTSAEARA